MQREAGSYRVVRGNQMISLNGRVVKPEELQKEITNNQQRTILKQMAAYPVVYYYQSLQQLKFELLFRVNTIKAATALDKSGAKFTTFAYSFPNKKYWNRLPNGGFLLRDGENPSEGIEDILKNGKLYAFECATAIAIVLYISVLYTIGPRAFNTYFNKLYLMDWQFDEDLPVYQKDGEDFIIGDVLHFKNPQFDPKQPWWRAENVIFFGDDKFYGHGIGIRDSQTIITFLNGKRKENATESAYLMRMITRPNYKTIFLLR
jgi:protein-glutamine gamma-glutamyltransferase